MKDPILIISAFSLGTSLLALVISAATFYFNLLKKADLEIVVGNSISFASDQNGILQLVAEFTLINEGALPGALVELRGSISTKEGGRNANFHWYSFMESKDTGKPGDPFRLWQAFAGLAEVISLPGRATVSRWVALLTEDRFDFTEGDYFIEFIGLEGPKRRVISKVKYPIHVTSQDVRYLNEKCIADSEGNYEDSLRLTRSE